VTGKFTKKQRPPVEAACVGEVHERLRILDPAGDGPDRRGESALAIAKAETKLRDKIATSCTNDQVAALDACGGNVLDAQICLACTHDDAASLPVGAQYRAVRVASPSSTFQAAADAAGYHQTSGTRSTARG
jgi:hypothetical protein